MAGMSEKAENWIEARGLDVELASRLGLESYVGRDGGEVLVFPYVVGGQVVNRKYRHLGTKGFRQDKGATKCLWNFNVLVEPTLADYPLVITEGEPDAIAAIQSGFPRSVSVPDGAPAIEIKDEASRKYSYLEHARTALKDCREIILAVDGDEPGRRLLNDLAIRLGKAKCKWVAYPEGSKDLNDVLLRHGESTVREILGAAAWCKVDGVYLMSDLPPYPKRLAYKTGFDWLDKHYKIRMGDFCVITGKPGDGKSTFVHDLTCRLADLHGWRIAMASFEQHPQADHRRALREWHCRCPLTNELGDEIALPDQIAAADRWIDEHFVFVVPDDDDLANLEWTLDKCASATIRYGARVVVVDPWNELDHERPRDVSLTEYTGRAIKEFKRLARHLDIHVIVVAHPTKLDKREDASLYMISDSAHWANKPDVGIVIHKGSPDNPYAECRVVKSRYHDQIGVPGTVHMRYERLDRRFSYADPPPPPQEDSQ